MELDISFYDQYQAHVTIVFAPGEPAENYPKMILYIAAWYAARQFSNMGHVPIADALAGLLLWDGLAAELERPNPLFPSAIDLLVQTRTASHPGATLQETLSWRRSLAGDTLVEIIQEQLLARTLVLVEPGRRRPKKRFHAIIPPHVLQLHGFGPLGWKINFYAFQSTVALILHILLMFSHDQGFSQKLAYVLAGSAQAYVQDRVTMWNQEEIASMLVAGAEGPV